jgi:hypothetical protein
MDRGHPCKGPERSRREVHRTEEKLNRTTSVDFFFLHQIPTKNQHKKVVSTISGARREPGVLDHGRII